MPAFRVQRELAPQTWLRLDASTLRVIWERSLTAPWR